MLERMYEWMQEHLRETAEFLSDACRNYDMPTELEKDIFGCSGCCRNCQYGDGKGDCDTEKIFEELRR